MVGLFNLYHEHIRRSLAAECERDNLAVQAEQSAAQIQVVKVVECLHDCAGLALKVALACTAVQVAPVHMEGERILAVFPGHVLVAPPPLIGGLEAVNEVALALQFLTGERAQLFREVDIIVTVLAVMRERELARTNGFDTLDHRLSDRDNDERKTAFSGILLERIQRSAAAVAEADCLCSLAGVAVKNNYCCPAVDESGVIEIHQGRHPVVEAMRPEALFVPNDTYMGRSEDRVSIITGPNMAGKSTYMRQVALMVLMAQIGSFVPAKAARLGIVDRIFTRIGASDDLSAGQSTFMVEMTEVSDILHAATDKSLLILDEIGRGTSTFDGMSIARAVLEYCADPKRLGAKTLFATHYHELTAMEGTLPGVKNYNIAVRTRGEEIVFLRKIVPGGADRSYGIEVAKLAGLPEAVVSRARKILRQLEEESGRPAAAPAPREDQVSFAAVAEGEVIDRLRRAQVDSLTPLEALQLLYELKKKLT